MTNETLKQEKPDFNEYKEFCQLQPGSICFFGNEEDEDDFVSEYKTPATYILGVEKTAGADETSGRAEGNEHSEVKYSADSIEVGRARKWADSLKQEHRRELFERYYVEGYHRLCLAFQIAIEEGAPLYKTVLPFYLIAPFFQGLTKERAEQLADSFCEHWLGLMRSEHDNRFTGQGRFLTSLRRVREIAHMYEVTGTLKPEEFDKLRQLPKRMPKEENITCDFLHAILDSLTESLLQDRIISQCQLCGDFFRYVRWNKKFCSLKSEGKDCGGKARDHRYYQKHREEITTKARRYAKERRKGRKESVPRT